MRGRSFLIYLYLKILHWYLEKKKSENILTSGGTYQEEEERELECLRSLLAQEPENELNTTRQLPFIC